MAHLDEEGNIVLDDADFESEANPYVKRFNDYRSEADRRQSEFSQTQQRLADLQSEDPEAQRRAAEALGLQFVDDVEDPELEQPNQLSQLEKRIAAFEEKEAAREAAQQKDEEAAAFSSAMDAHVESLGMKKDDPDTAIIIAHAAQNLPWLENGLPDLEIARTQLEQRDDQRFDTWRKTKRTAPVQRGQQGSEQKAIEDMSPEERIDYVMAQHEME